MEKLTFNVSVDEANLILEGLGKLPFERVFALIGKLQQQASGQLKTNGEEKTPPKANIPLKKAD